MSLIRVFPRRTSHTPTDDLTYVGDPGLFTPEADEVHVSVTFTWDKAEGERLAAAWEQYYPTKIGGPAYGSPIGAFVPGRYIKHGVTFTTRGCDNRCPWCLVPEREGRLIEIPDFPPGNIVQDNNLLQASPAHLEKVWSMLEGQTGILFAGGLDARLITEEIAERIRSLSVKYVYLAADSKARLAPLKRAVDLLGMPHYKVRVYVLIGFHGETIEAARDRLETVCRIGAMPHAQLFQPADRLIEYSQEWKALAREYSRPQIIRANMRKAGLI